MLTRIVIKSGNISEEERKRKRKKREGERERETEEIMKNV